MLQGTPQMALAEAQGAGILKPGAAGFTSGSLQNTTELASRMQSTVFTRAQITGKFNHFDQMKSAATAISNRLATIETQFGQLNRLSPEAARVARQGYQPLINTAGQRIQLTQMVEDTIIEISNSGSADRLKGMVFSETGREAEHLAANQLQQRGVSLLPNAVSQGQSLMQQISKLPINAAQASQQLKELATKGAAGMASAVQALRMAGPVATSAARTAAITVVEYFIALGCNLTTIPLIIRPEPKGA